MTTTHKIWLRFATITLICLLLLPMFTACSSPTVLTVGEEKVSYDLLRYFVMNYRAESGHTAEEFAADETLQKELTEFVESRLKEIMAYQMLADKYDIDITRDEQKALEAELEETKAEYESEEAFEEALEAAYMTEDVYMELQKLQLLASHLYNYLTNEHAGELDCSEATVRADVEAGNFFAAEYLYIYFSAKDKDEKLAFADTLYSRLLAGETMTQLDDEFSATYGLSMERVTLPAFTYTQQDEEFEKIVLSLEIGAYSDPVVRGDGVFIVNRKAIDSKYVDENIDMVIECYKEREFTRLVQATSDAMEITFKSKYESLKYWEME